VQQFAADLQQHVSLQQEYQPLAIYGALIVLAVADTDHTTMYRDTKVHDTGIVYAWILFSAAIPKVSQYCCRYYTYGKTF